MYPLYPRFRLIALVVAVPVAAALLNAQGVGIGLALALGFAFALGVELTGWHVAQRDQRAAAELAAASERERVRQAIAQAKAQESVEGPGAEQE